MIEIELTQGQVALVDDIDADLAKLNWYAQYTPKTGAYYAKRTVAKGSRRTGELMHRVILSRILGRELLQSEDVDHIYHKTLDNRRSEIRLATRSQNNINVNMRVDNTSGYKGVSFHKLTGKWLAATRSHGRTLHLGLFDTPEQAAVAYNSAVTTLHPEFAYINEVL